MRTNLEHLANLAALQTLREQRAYSRDHQIDIRAILTLYTTIAAEAYMRREKWTLTLQRRLNAQH